MNDLKREQVLNQIFENINKWLTFAEAKNAALAAFNSGISIALFNLLRSQGDSIDPYLKFYVIFCALTFMLSTAFCLFSFMPATRFKMHFENNPASTDNMYFYGSIVKHTNESYLKLVSEKKSFDFEYSKSDFDMANQIISNSKIACKKFEIFKKALWITFSGVTSPIGFLALYYFTDPDKH